MARHRGNSGAAGWYHIHGISSNRLRRVTRQTGVMDAANLNSVSVVAMLVSNCKFIFI